MTLPWLIMVIHLSAGWDGVLDSDSVFLETETGDWDYRHCHNTRRLLSLRCTNVFATNWALWFHLKCSLNALTMEDVLATGQCNSGIICQFVVADNAILARITEQRGWRKCIGRDIICQNQWCLIREGQG
mmetsp:Transcript_9456/g.20463  ORF Transcript_9456/g.20463 Transcript_9456/m.20463 type:complete len:130 (-) Transcript_9456:558-947(-)